MMTTSRISLAFALVLAAVGPFGGSCTAILAPNDSVQRCDTATDCEPTGDNRYISDCRFDAANVTLDTSRYQKVCVAEYRPSVGCGSDSLDPTSPYGVAFETLADSARYLECDPETQLGTRGCLPNGGACDAGLVVNEVGLCDDDDPSTPMAIRITAETIGQDIRDQYCRSFFCDERFVCNTSTNFCVLCDEERALGAGGCGEVYIAGAPSCVYSDNGQCEGADVTPETVTFGCSG